MTKFIIAALLSLPASSFACGGFSAEGYQGNEALLKEIDRKPLVCEYNGIQSEALVESFALYRCINSPVRVELTAFDDKQDISQIALKDGAYLLTGSKADLEIRCQLK